MAPLFNINRTIYILENTDDINAKEILQYILNFSTHIYSFNQSSNNSIYLDLELFTKMLSICLTNLKETISTEYYDCINNTIDDLYSDFLNNQHVYDLAIKCKDY